MILADKILSLRKNAGMSQEELAEKLNVSRQSVSKWEGAQAIPDISKIVQMAQLFGVSTDYLLNEEMQSVCHTDEAGVIKLGAETANAYINAKVKNARITAVAVVLCILSPALLIFLGGLSEPNPWGVRISEGAALAIGLGTLMFMVAIAVALFIYSTEGLRRFNFIKESDYELTYGVEGIIRKRREDNRGNYLLCVIGGVVLSILAPLPLLISAAFECADIVYILLVDVLLAIISFAVALFIAGTGLNDACDALLGEGEYSKAEKARNQKSSRFSGFYWPSLTAVYLLLSFTTNGWELTWLVWPVGALIFVGINALIKNQE